MEGTTAVFLLGNNEDSFSVPANTGPSDLQFKKAEGTFSNVEPQHFITAGIYLNCK